MTPSSATRSLQRGRGGGRPRCGAASLALRPLLDPPRRAARVIAVFPSALYLEMRGGPEPRVLAVVTSDAGRLPNAVVVVATRREHPFRSVREGGDAFVGEGRVEADGLAVRVRRWWDPVACSACWGRRRSPAASAPWRTS